MNIRSDRVGDSARWLRIGKGQLCYAPLARSYRRWTSGTTDLDPGRAIDAIALRFPVCPTALVSDKALRRQVFQHLLFGFGTAAEANDAADQSAGAEYGKHALETINRQDIADHGGAGDRSNPWPERRP